MKKNGRLGIVALICMLMFVGCGAAEDVGMEGANTDSPREVLTLSDIMPEEDIAMLSDEELELIKEMGLDALSYTDDDAVVSVEKWPVDWCRTASADVTETYDDGDNHEPFGTYGAQTQSAYPTNQYDHGSFCLNTFLYQANNVCGASMLIAGVHADDISSLSQSTCSSAHKTIKYYAYNGQTESWETLQTGGCTGSWTGSSCGWDCTPSGLYYYELPSTPHQYTIAKMGVSAWIDLGGGYTLYKKAITAAYGTSLYQCQ